jgi:hypothetical protein
MKLQHDLVSTHVYPTQCSLWKVDEVLGVTPADLIEYVPDGKEEA